ncbi:MAG TPA: type IV pilus twitching motility protein PilT [Syntrophomonadaceae bacterium]|nr:type IV pilus twitching motility protein PilT [Syntrophomonadaceae bacterium]HRX22208.1 type IV pilus twitching motility protein PilT [Syntrophomonadaceae bacterium]
MASFEQVLKVVELARIGVEKGASDIHLTVKRPPTFRVNGTLISLEGYPELTPDDTYKFAQELMPDEKNIKQIEAQGHADFSLSIPNAGRVRVNIYLQRGSYAIAIRLIPQNIPEIDTLGLPPVCKELVKSNSGLILVTGPTGSGKSTTLAAMIQVLNKTQNANIITLEDPIEYLHKHGTCIINQREVGTDCPDFAQGLRASLRQDPDVILVGEMRDLETISTAMTAAETGHLVMATLHAATAIQTVERVVDVFPPHQQAQIRVQLADTLLGVISQQLIPRADGKGRVLACEVLTANPAVRNLIRDSKTYQLNTVMQTGSSQGMVTMEKSIKSFVDRGLISSEEAQRRMMKLKQ